MCRHLFEEQNSFPKILIKKLAYEISSKFFVDRFHLSLVLGILIHLLVGRLSTTIVVEIVDGDLGPDRDLAHNLELIWVLEVLMALDDKLKLLQRFLFQFL